jgi:hypothetical protein
MALVVRTALRCARVGQRKQVSRSSISTRRRATVFVRPTALDANLGEGGGQGGERARAAIQTQDLHARAAEAAAHQIVPLCDGLR